MTQLIRQNLYLSSLNKFNPQLAQEIKLRIKLKSFLALIFKAFAWQFALVILALGKLPDIIKNVDPPFAEPEQFSRYCTGATGKFLPNQQQLLCIQDLNNHWLINWQLFWFDIFAIISAVSIALLIGFGTYLIVNNLRREQQQGNLTLITLAPQPAIQFFLGKILGVPILLYGFLAMGLPLHLVAGLLAGIHLSLILTFYLAIIASCSFFYSLGSFFAYRTSSSSKTRNHLATIIPIAIAGFLLLTTSLNHNIYSQNFGNVGDWLLLFNPLNLILYLGQITALPVHYFSYLPFDFLSVISSHPELDQFQQSNVIGLANISFYGQSLQRSIGLGLGVVIANFLMGAYWFWQGIKRCFYNPEQSPISKEHSYWLSLQVGFFALGLTLNTNQSPTFINNFGWLICLLAIFSLILIFSLSPGHYQLRDWIHNRKTNFYGQNSLGKDLVFGESSPANLAIAINLIIIACFVAPSLIIFPIGNQAFSILSKITLQLSLLFLFATLWQWLKLKYHQNQFKNKSLLLLGAFVPVVIATNLTFLSPAIIPGFISLAIGIITQWLAIILITGKTMKMLLANNKQIPTSKIRGSKKQLNPVAIANQQKEQNS